MARKARIFIPGCLHHIMARGIEGASIFRDSQDRDTFLSLLASCLKECGIKCYAWALMDNHYHLVVRTAEFPLARLMKPLNSMYAGYFNKKYSRRGYLFQDRFKSIASQDQGYIEEMIRYVHLNPVRAKVCKTIVELDHYPWCGHGAIMGNISRPFMDTFAVLSRFGVDETRGRKAYRDFMEKGLHAGLSEMQLAMRYNLHAGRSSGESARWVIGDHEFVRSALLHDAENRLRIAKRVKEGWGLEQIAESIAGQFKIDSESLLHKSRSNSRSYARKVFAYVAREEQGFPAADIARYLNVDGSAVSRMIVPGKEIAMKRKITLSH